MSKLSKFKPVKTDKVVKGVPSNMNLPKKKSKKSKK